MTCSRRGPQCRRMGERGSALIEFSWLAIMLMVPTLWLVLAVFDVQRASFALTNAARSAGRAYALASSDAAGEAAAQAAIKVAFADQFADQVDDQGDGASRVRVSITCRPSPRACHTASSVVTVRLATSVGLPWLPASLGLGDPSFALDARHTLPIGRYQETSDAQ